MSRFSVAFLPGIGPALSKAYWRFQNCGMNQALRRKLAGAMLTYRKGPAAGDLGSHDWNGRRIVLLKLEKIGDFVLGTTSLRLIEKHFAGAKITLVCQEPVDQLARHQFPGWEIVELPAKETPSILRLFFRHVRTRLDFNKRGPFDLLVDFCATRDRDDSTVASWVPSKIKVALENQTPSERLWAAAGEESRIYDILLPKPEASPGVSFDIQNQRSLASFLIPNRPDECGGALPNLRTSKAEKVRVGEWLESKAGLKAGSPFLLVCPGARVGIRQYPVEDLAEAINRVMAVHPMPVVLTGSRADIMLASALAKRITGGAVANLTGTMSLQDHLALVSLATAVLCMETSHSHIAGALGRPAVVITGGGHYGLFAPWVESASFRWITNPLPCFGCHWRCIYDKPLCIRDIKPEAVAGGLLEVISASSRPV